MTTPVALTIAAHDPLGGAGIAADVTTFAALGVHGAVAVTAVTAQTLSSVDRVEPTDAAMLRAQVDGITASLDVAATKVGLVASADAVDVTVAAAGSGGLGPVVVDPVLVDGRGAPIVASDVQSALRERLFPIAAVLTPNLTEAAVLAGRPPGSLRSVDDVAGVSGELAALGAALVVVTGGAGDGTDAVDVVVMPDGTVDTVAAPRLRTDNVRGSGCTFAAALTASLALGSSPPDAVRAAKRFVTARLVDSADERWSGAAGPVSHRIAAPVPRRD